MIVLKEKKSWCTVPFLPNEEGAKKAKKLLEKGNHEVYTDKLGLLSKKEEKPVKKESAKKAKKKVEVDNA